MAMARRIKQLLQQEPVHAACDIPAFSLAAIIGIDLGRGQSSAMDDIRLAADLSFGSLSIKIGDEHYTLSLASVRVILEKDNADIAAGSKYSHVLSEGEVVGKASDLKTSDSGHSYSVEAKAGWPGTITGGIFGGGKRSHAKKLEDHTNVTHRINFVSPEGQDSWRIGGPDGDPRLPTKDLRGPVINSIWDEEPRPLCRFEAIDPDQPVSGCLRIQASPEDFRLRGKASEAVAKDMVLEGLSKDQRKLAKRANSAEEQLRERVAAMALFKPMLPQARKQPDEGMLDLAARSFAFIPDIEEPGA